MEVTATAKNVRISPKKVKLVVDQIKKIPPQEAIQILDFINKSSSIALRKVIKGAIANAKNNFGLDQNSLVLKSIYVNKGSMFNRKRFQPVARGRAHPILKRTSHIKVILEGEKEKKVSEVSQVSKELEESKIKDQKSKTKSIKHYSLPTERRLRGPKS